jgi:hypothetical protein
MPSRYKPFSYRRSLIIGPSPEIMEMLGLDAKYQIMLGSIPTYICDYRILETVRSLGLFYQQRKLWYGTAAILIKKTKEEKYPFEDEFNAKHRRDYHPNGLDPEVDDIEMRAKEAIAEMLELMRQDAEDLKLQQNLDQFKSLRVESFELGEIHHTDDGSPVRGLTITFEGGKSLSLSTLDIRP